MQFNSLVTKWSQVDVAILVHAVQFNCEFNSTKFKMNNEDSAIPDLFVSTIRSINSKDSKRVEKRRKNVAPKKRVQEELYKFFNELMIEWKVERQWGPIVKINIRKIMSRHASTYYGFLRFKNRNLHPTIANQLNGTYFNDGRLTVELNKNPPRDIRLESSR